MSAKPPPRTDFRTMHLWQMQPVRDVLVIALIVGIIYVGKLLSPITVPMLLALTLAYLFEPIVRRITRNNLTRNRPIPRSFAAGMIVVFIVVIVAVPTVIGGTFAIVQGVSYAEKLAQKINQLREVANAPADESKLQELGDGRWRDIGIFLEDIQLGRFGAARPAPPDSKADPKRDPNAAPTSDDAATTPPVKEPPSQPESQPDPAKTDLSKPTLDPALKDAIKAAIHEDKKVESAAQPGAAEAAKPSPIDGLINYMSNWAQDNTGTIGRVTRQLFGTGAEAVAFFAHFIKSAALLAFSLFLTLFFFFFFSSRWGDVRDGLVSMIPAQQRDRWLELGGRMDRVIAAFIRGRLTIMAILAGLYIIGYWIIGVPAPLVVGLIVGVFSAVPYMPLLGIPISILLMFLMPVGAPHSTAYILLVPALVYFIIQMSDDYFWTPLIQGKATDMDTPSILFAVLSGALLGGFYGVLIAIPLGACFKIVIKEVLVPRFKEWAEGRASDILPIAHEPEQPHK